jgi:hypothetical protein
MVNVNADWFDVTDIKKVIDVIASLPVWATVQSKEEK